MDNPIAETVNKTEGFINKVTSFDAETKNNLLNGVQYVAIATLPVAMSGMLLNHLFGKSEPETKGSIELLAEIFIQLVIMFVGIIIIHRIITYIPTYSGFKYENLTLTNVVLAFLVIVLSIQTKLGLKVNILIDRALELWNGPSTHEKKEGMKNNMKVSKPVSQHSPSQADYLDNSGMQNGLFPPAPVSTTRQNSVMESYDHMMHTGGNGPVQMDPGPMAANGLLGGSFGSSF